eukprot:3214379-Pyramimonas_sp.AAC.1
MDSGVFPWLLSARNARHGEMESSESLLSETQPPASHWSAVSARQVLSCRVRNSNIWRSDS